MRRREFLTLLGGTAAAWPLPSRAQQRKAMPRVGVLWHAANAREEAEYLGALTKAFHELGYVEGKNIELDHRFPAEQPERFRALAQELVESKVDMIVAVTGLGAKAAKQATGTIPIVLVADPDPVGNGFAESLARPGGNVTGLSLISPELSAKRLELLKEVVPGLSRVAIMWNPDVRGAVLDYKETEGAARSLRLQLQSVEVSRADDFDRAFSALTTARAEALIVVPFPVAFTNRGRIASLAQKNRLPSMYGQREYADAGGLMAYGPNNAEQWRRAATYVDKILKGAKPGDLPIEQPTKFELVINLKTAKALGLTIPPSLLRRADEVIQ